MSNLSHSMNEGQLMVVVTSAQCSVIRLVYSSSSAMRQGSDMRMCVPLLSARLSACGSSREHRLAAGVDEQVDDDVPLHVHAPLVRQRSTAFVE